MSGQQEVVNVLPSNIHFDPNFMYGHLEMCLEFRR